ncbi:hypothetical protein ZEAMMB73_Zm00001d045357 [Zea mays]|uniref:Uncharacterized protein n=1 Tax=Zea mays TaxID=4577 RepID=A0A1D6NVH2_MAIZE|nr:hypothetical protein ZEAMMB73_Zm00001d045357 [Zea mays]
MEEQVKRKNWEKEMVLEYMKREEDLLKQVKELYRKQKQELMDYVTQPAVTHQLIHLQLLRVIRLEPSSPTSGGNILVA